MTASEYFNSLPREQRAKLGPLLEEYRRMGMAEYAREVKAATRKMDNRMRDIERGSCVCSVNTDCDVHP